MSYKGPMDFPHIVKSPKIKGRGVRVSSVAACADYGKSPDWIAESLGLTLEEVQAALTYYAHNVDEIRAEWEEDELLEQQGKGFLGELANRIAEAKKGSFLDPERVESLKKLEDKIAALRGGNRQKA